MQHRPRWPLLALCGSLAVHVCAAGMDQHAERLESLIHRYVEAQRSEGDADPIFTQAEFAAQRETNSALLDALNEIDLSVLSRAQHIDLRYLKGVLESDLHTASVQQRWANDPAMYLPARQLGKLLDVDSPDPVVQRRQELTTLLESLEDGLAEAKRVLARPPSRFTHEAIFQARNTLEAMQRHTLESPQAAIPENLADSIQALQAHLAFLEEDLAPRSDGSWVFGEANYNFILQRRWHMKTDAGQILSRGQQAFDKTVTLAAQVARRIDPEAHWTEVYERLKDNHASAQEMKQAYQQPMDEARKFVLEQRILTLPEGERVITLDTPAAMRRSSPFGTFQSVSPFDDGLEGRLYLTPLEDWMNEEQQQNRLRSHHLAWTPVIAVHEAYPGHHAHFLKVRENPRLLRRVAREPIFSEGWGLYTEELMFQWGFLKGDAVRLTQLRNRLWRAARVILDVSLHTGRMDFESAVDFLVEQVRFDRYAAELEVGMYIRRPTYVLGYLIGMQELARLREDWIAANGEPDPPSEFYDQLLTVGAIPPALARAELLDEPLP